MPEITFTGVFTSRQEVTLDITQEEWEDLKSGKKKYYDFLDDGDYDSGEWVEGSAIDWETMEMAGEDEE